MKRNNNGIYITWVYSHVTQLPLYTDMITVFPIAGRGKSKYLQYWIFTRSCILGGGGAVAWSLRKYEYQRVVVLMHWNNWSFFFVQNFTAWILMINEHVWFFKGLLSGKKENINCIMKVSITLIRVSHHSLTDLK